MKKITLLLSCFLFCLPWCFSLQPLSAQTTSVIAGPACIDAAADSVTYELVTSSSSTTYGYRWYAKGDIEIVATNGNKVTIRSVSQQTGARPGYAKGRLFVSHRKLESDPCGPFLAQLDVYKSFSLKNGTANVSIIGPTCVVPGDTVAYSIDPVLSRNLNDEIGLDSYQWTFPEGWRAFYYSGDSASVTLIAGPGVSGAVAVGVGRCNIGDAAKQLSLNLSQKAAKPVFVQKPACVPGDVSTITVSVRQVAGVSYKWTKPSNWTIAHAGVSNGENYITLKVDGNPGEVIVEAGTPGSLNRCASDTAMLLITRSLGANSTISGEACLEAGMIRTYTLTNAPVNSSFRWRLPAGWSFASPDSSAQTVQVKTGTQGGVLSVAVTGANCQSEPRTMNIQVRPARPLPIAGAVCLSPNTSNHTYSIDPVERATSYTWTLSGGLTSSSTLVNGGTSIAVNVGSAGGDIRVVANNGSCPGTEQKRTVSLVPVAPVISASRSCFNPGVPWELTFSAGNHVAGYTYAWQVVDAATNQVSTDWTIKSGTPTNAASVTFVTNGAGGSYKVQARATAAGCGTSAWGTSGAFAALPDVTVNVQKKVDPQGVEFGEWLSAEPVGSTSFLPGTTYQWFKNGVAISQQTNRLLVLEQQGDYLLDQYCVVVSNGSCTPKRACADSEYDLTSAAARMNSENTTSPETELSRRVSVYPNPGNGEFTLSLPAFKGQARVALKTLQGKTVFRKGVSQQKSKLAPGKLTSGVYLLQVTLDGKTVTKKVQVQK